MDELKFNAEDINLLESIKSLDKSNTQSIKVLLIEKENQKFLSIQKWWRKSKEEPWNEGKGFHLDESETNELKDAIIDACRKIK
jgi:hypothetical protein